MTRLLAPYLWLIIGALAAALVAAVGWIVLQGQWLEQAEADLKLATDYIQGRKDADASLSHLPDDPNAILDGLRACADGGTCFGNP
jgi:hypothetical protein